MKMRLHDRLYLRFGLFHKKYGHAIAYLIEFLLVAFICFMCLMVMLSAFKFAKFWYANYSYTQTQAALAGEYEKVLIKCLNGEVIGHAGDEVIACEKAVTFKWRKM